MRISDWSSDVCSSDLIREQARSHTGSYSQIQFVGASLLAKAIYQATSIRLKRRSTQNYPGLLHIFLPMPDQGAELVRLRSDERRVGKECGSTGRSRWSP